MKKRIICTVTTDLNFDQRMIRICSSLSEMGYDVLLVGREKRNSKPLQSQPFRQHRIKCRFEKGKLFYLEYNYRLYRYLKENAFDALCSCDLDTMLPGYLLKRRSNREFKWVYDAHEYFTQLEEVVKRPLVKSIWKSVEKMSVPLTDQRYTVSNGYAELFEKEYKLGFDIIRNIARKPESRLQEKRENIILYQGSVNVGRGLNELIDAMHRVDASLVICGEGDLYLDLKEKVKNLGLENKITFTGYVLPEELKNYTRKAKIGITLFTQEGVSNRYSLANRFFDYLQHGVPQLAMNYPEYASFNKEYEVATLLDTIDVSSITSSLNHLLKNSAYYNRLRDNALLAREKYNWQHEAERLGEIYQGLLGA